MTEATHVLDSIEQEILQAEDAAYEENLPDLIADLKRRRDIKKQIEALEDELAFLDEQLIKVMGDKDVLWDEGDQKVVVTVVKSNTTTIDMDVLEKVDPKLLGLITKQVVDTVKFNEAKDLHFFDEGKPAHAALVVKPKKPYLSYKSKKTALKETSDA